MHLIFMDLKSYRQFSNRRVRFKNLLLRFPGIFSSEVDLFCDLLWFHGFFSSIQNKPFRLFRFTNFSFDVPWTFTRFQFAIFLCVFFSPFIYFTYYFWLSLQRRLTKKLRTCKSKLEPIRRSIRVGTVGRDGPRCLSDENWETATRSQLLIDWKFKTNSSNYSQTPFVAVCP